MTHLEALEATTGALYSKKDWDAAEERAQTAPTAVTDLDLAIIEHFDGAKKAAEVQARRSPAPAATVPPTPPAPPALTKSVFVAWLKDEMEPVLDFIERMNAKNHERNAQIRELQAQVAELAARPTLKDAGVWKSGCVYDEGAIVSHAGSAWICSGTHTSGVEIDHQHFRLLVKRPAADGRGAR